MNFFQQLAELSPDMDLSLRLMKKGDTITVTVLPATAEKIKPLTIAGTPAELDEKFIETIAVPLDLIAQLDTSDYVKELKKLVKEKQKEAEKKVEKDTGVKVADLKAAEAVESPKVEEPAKEEAPAQPAAEPAPAAAPAQPVTPPQVFGPKDKVIVVGGGEFHGKVGTVTSEATAEGVHTVDLDFGQGLHEFNRNILSMYRKHVEPAPQPAAAPAPPRPQPPRPGAPAAQPSLL
jgi:PRTRC genetic system protein E